MAIFTILGVVLLGVFGAWIYEPTREFANILGYRPNEAPDNIHGMETLFIPDTVACEDLEYHAPSRMLYTACSADLESARGWNPGAWALERHDKPAFGTIVVVDPKTLQSQKLSLEGFEGPLATHGIGLYTPPSKPETVYIYAINHLPNPKWTPGSKAEKTASQVELFVHRVGGTTAQHVRSIASPLIRTPNDLLGISENEFLVTNDHYYLEGPMRLVESLFPGLQKWTDIVHVRFDDNTVNAAKVLDTVPALNGIGWGPEKQVIIGSGMGGRIYFGSLPHAANRTMTVSHHVPMDAIVDNPSFFSDPYAGLDGKDYSGYLMPGTSDPLTFIEALKDPTSTMPMPGRVHYLPAVAGKDKTVNGKKLRKLIFKDDGQVIRSLTSAVIVAIDPAVNGGKREGWLFVTSIIGSHMVANKINFETVLAA
ncbi:hypothetical protein GGS21DRAFT_496110 [Xylaria nigripes]|nr:hypothetical protein GGS21DRAFT_496110 [Xylaria nigripes]